MTPKKHIDKKLITFRCPEDLMAEIDLICSQNYMDRTSITTYALRNLIQGLEEQQDKADAKPEQSESEQDADEPTPALK